MLRADLRRFLEEMAGRVEYSQRKFKGGYLRAEEANRLLEAIDAEEVKPSSPQSHE